MQHVMIAGVGNIGSHVVSHLGRLPGLEQVTLIDKDRYEAKNLMGQEMDSGDIGKSKVKVQAERLRRIHPKLRIEAIAEPVENLPLGRLRCSLILGALDSRRARQYLNQAAWRLGVPWIDSGVDPGGLLARVNAYQPGAENPCLECSWSDEDYRALEAVYPCNERAADPAASNSPSGLGALAASLLMIEAQKYLAGRHDQVIFGRQVLIDALYHKQYLASCRRSPHCRFDHRVWSIERLPSAPRKWTLGAALRIGSTASCENGNPWLSVEGKPFVTKLTCSNCGHTKSIIRLQCSLSLRETACALCGHAMLASGWDMTEKLTNNLPQRKLSRSLQSFGLRPGEIITIGDATREQHFEITVIGRD